MKVGYSLSLCVIDICNGDVDIEDVERIETSTAFVTDEDWERGMRDYCATCWREFTERARDVVSVLRANGKIIQPRVADATYYRYVGGGTHWQEL